MKPAACVVDEIASRLAAQAGLSWMQLGEHPGYRRNIFREQARSIIDSMAAAMPADMRRDP